MNQRNATVTIEELTELLEQHNIPLRISLTGNVPTWELSPSALHQGIIDDIRATIRLPPERASGCGCFHIADVWLRLPGIGLRRPDIAIYCERPPRQRTALTLVPTAVIEIVSAGYEHKDLDAVPLYLAAGIADVVLVNPETTFVTHYTTDGAVASHQAPCRLEFQSGCVCDIPTLSEEQ
jgi:Uma2 family endonuclease